MDLNLTAEEQAFRDELRAWLTSNVPKDWNESGSRNSMRGAGQRFRGPRNTVAAVPR